MDAGTTGSTLTTTAQDQYARVMERGIRLFKENYTLPTEETPPHRVLKEILRNYISWRDHLASRGFQDDVIEHSYFVADNSTDPPGIRKVTLSISFSDLQNCLLPQSKGGVLSERKREALLYNIVFDWKQKDVAAKMGITPVSVGQYADLALRQLAKLYFTEEDMATSQYDYGRTK
jgi:DNA-directed RNA polymerase specialized sigma24 family protein